MEPVEIDLAKTATKAMKSIHFDDMKNRGWIAVLILSGILILAGGFEVILFEKPAVNKFIRTLSSGTKKEPTSGSIHFREDP